MTIKYFLSMLYIALLCACSDPQEKPITAKEQVLLLRVLDSHHELQVMYNTANADGVITKKEYLNLLYQVSEANDVNGK